MACVEAEQLLLMINAPRKTRGTGVGKRIDFGAEKSEAPNVSKG